MNLSAQDVKPLDSRHPFQTFLLVVCLANGGPLVFGITTSRSVVSQTPEWAWRTWGVLLLIGGLMGLVGMFWPRLRITGLLIERTGLVFVGLAALVFSGVLAVTVGLPDSGFAAGVTAAFGGAALWQAWRIAKALRRVRRTLHRLVNEESNERQ